MASKHLPAVDEELRIVLVGKTGDGKTATMKTLMGRLGLTAASSFSDTTQCEKQRNVNLLVIDTPGTINTKMTNKELRKEIMKCIIHATPGPHAIVYVLKPRALTPEDKKTKEDIQSIFGEESKDYTLLLYTYGDQPKLLQDIQKKTAKLKQHEDLRKEVGDRHLTFNNKDESPDQVSELLEMINNMVKEKREKNRSPYYTNEMFEGAQKVLEQEKEKQGMKPTDTPSQGVLDRVVDTLLEMTAGEPLKTVVKEIHGRVERAAAKCATQ